MARTLIETCDPCEKFLEIEGMPAERSVLIAIDGGPPKRVEVCTQHLHMLKPLLDMYERCGVDESLKPKKRATSKREPELSGENPTATAEEPRQLEMGQTAEPAPQEQPKKKPKTEKKDLWLVCPLPHSSKQGGSLRVRYGNRGTHANMVHELQAWDIPWEDPDGILAVRCEEHAECQKTGFGFTSTLGLKQHLYQSQQHKLATEDLANIA